jgi:hypothetical protein
MLMVFVMLFVLFVEFLTRDSSALLKENGERRGAKGQGHS